MSQTKVVERIKTGILCSIVSSPENRVFYEIMWKNTVERGMATDDNVTRRMRCAYWIIKITTTHSEYITR
jgi:hypothetical protein